VNRFAIPLVAGLAFLGAGCGNGDSDPAGVTGKQGGAAVTTTTLPTVDPGNTEYKSAFALATALDEAGFACAPEDTGSGGISSWAKCTVPPFSDREPMSFTVWNTPELAVGGIKASLEYLQALADLPGRVPRYFIVVGKNWEIQVGHDSDLAKDVAENFGGKLRSTH